MSPRPLPASLAVLAMLALPLAGCLAGGQGEVDRSVFTTLQIAEPESLDPAYDYETAGGAILQNVYDTLVYYRGASATELQPLLLTEVPTLDNGGISPDGSVYTFHLKHGVRFTDGSELTADDVKFSFDRLILMNDPNSPAWIQGGMKGATDYMGSRGTQADRDAYLAARGVEALDESTVRVSLDGPDAAFLYKLAFTQGSIVSSRAFKAPHDERIESWGVAATPDGLPPPATASRERVTRDPWADRNTVGTGPFMLQRWLPGDKVLLARNPSYAGSPAPAVQAVIFQKVGDLNTRILMLQTRQADDIYVSPADLPQVEGKPFVRIEEAPSFTVGTMVMTQHITNRNECPTDAASGQPDCDFFADAHMRRVFSYAMDYPKLLRDVGRGHLQNPIGVVPKGMFGYADGVQPYTFDLQAARQELAQSPHPQGFKVKVYFNTGNAVREGAAQVLKQGLEQVSSGITVQVQPLDWATALLPQGKKAALAAYFIGWAPDYAFPDDYVKPFADPRAGQYAKWAAFDDKDLDAMIDNASATVDPGQLQQLYGAMQQRMHDQAFYLYLYQQNNVAVLGPWVRGYIYNPMDSDQPNVGHWQYVSKTG